MHTQIRKVNGWMAPIPEEEYLRIVYVGKLEILPETAGRDKINDVNLEDMINEIWDVSKVWNRINCISGHLSYTRERYVSQLIEGKADMVNSLMEKIERDPRVKIRKAFRRKLQTMNHGWNIQMCYSFDLTNEQYRLVADEDITLEQMFDSMRNTYEIRREGWKLSEFYKTIVDTFLLKYISIDENVKFELCEQLQFGDRR